MVDRPVPQLADTEGTSSDVSRFLKMMFLRADGVPANIAPVHGNAGAERL